MNLRALCCFALFVCSQAIADNLGSEPSDKPSDSSIKPTEGINKFLKGITNSINGAVAQIQTKPQGNKMQQPNNQAVSPPEKTVSNQPTAQQPMKDNGILLSATSLNGIFAKHPYDGTTKSQYPKVAITITDWSSSDCWKARAKIWWSEKKGEPVNAFAVCWRDSLAKGQQAMSFVQQLLTETGWQGGGTTNIWVVGYEAGNH